VKVDALPGGSSTASLADHSQVWQRSAGAGPISPFRT